MGRMRKFEGGGSEEMRDEIRDAGISGVKRAKNVNVLEAETIARWLRVGNRMLQTAYHTTNKRTWTEERAMK